MYSYSINLKDPKYTPLTLEEEQELFRRYHGEASDEVKLTIKQTLVERNLRFAMMTTLKYNKRGNNTNILEDLFSEAIIGLTHAVDKYSPSHEVKFISYAVWWINRYLFEALRRANEIYVPPHKDKAEEPKFRFASIDSVVSDDNSEGTLADTLHQTLYDTPEEHASNISKSGLISKFIDVLDGREKTAFIMYYMHEIPYEDIAKKYGVSRERVRQWNITSMKRIRAKFPNTVANHLQII